jgi:hypothetical protein
MPHHRSTLGEDGGLAVVGLSGDASAAAGAASMRASASGAFARIEVQPPVMALEVRRETERVRDDEATHRASIRD